METEAHQFGSLVISWLFSSFSFSVACISKLHPQSYRESPVGLSRGEPLICQPLSGNRIHKAIKPVPSMPPHVAVIQSERKFVNIAPHVLFAGMMVDTVQTRFRTREYAFNAVCRYAFSEYSSLL